MLIRLQPRYFACVVLTRGDCYQAQWSITETKNGGDSDGKAERRSTQEEEIEGGGDKRKEDELKGGGKRK